MALSLGVGGVSLLTMAAAVSLPVFAADNATDNAKTSPAAKVDKLLSAGQYEAAAEAARSALSSQEDPRMRALLVQALRSVGERTKAAAEAGVLIDRNPNVLSALWVGYEAFLAAGDEGRATTILQHMRKVAGAPGVSIEDAEDLVAAGQAALLAGDEPKTVLTTFFEAALQKDRRCKAAFLAGGGLALAKNDDREAASWFERGLAQRGPDADLYAGLARAHYNGDRRDMIAALDAALHLNARHASTLLLRAEHEIDGEDYTAAGVTLDKVLQVDPGAPEAWAFRAVLAHLRNDRAAEEKARAQALAVRTRDPAIDTLIGRKLSQKYRFAEGAAYQRRALGFAAGHLPAKAQLAQDLLRLGKTKEGWSLAEEVHNRDGYDVTAYNLVTLRAHLDKFARLEKGGFLVRMAPKEARIYGDEVIALLQEASGKLDAKYGFARRGQATTSAQVAVEIFPDQADFAVRTFGMPGGSGYLGVCFGPLITMNSPAGTGAAPVNWRSVLWHEYTHVVTLGLTGNKIPRWLSEGISVHEEMAREANWGQRMTPAYRRMILEGELTPLSKMSSAFLSPKTQQHLMFAYYQSALAVAYLVERYGVPALRAVLTDLGRGVEINQALAARAATLPELEKGFASFAQKRAEALAPEADFSEPDPEAVPESDVAAIARYRKQHPNSVPALLLEARVHMETGAWAKARPLLERAIALHPDQTDADSAYLLLAQVHNRLGQIAEETKVLEALAARASGLAPAYRRLIEVAEQKGDAAALLRNADRLLGVNPMLEAGWRARGRAQETAAAGDARAASDAIAAYEKLLLLEPADQADTRFRLAKLLKTRDRRAAKRHLLEALVEAPRLRAGYTLLRELSAGGQTEAVKQ
jgi:tetratricopeptide (TPR) repeat protein